MKKKENLKEKSFENIEEQKEKEDNNEPELSGVILDQNRVEKIQGFLKNKLKSKSKNVNIEEQMLKAYYYEKDKNKHFFL